MPGCGSSKAHLTSDSQVTMEPHHLPRQRTPDSVNQPEDRRQAHSLGRGEHVLEEAVASRRPAHHAAVWAVLVAFFALVSVPTSTAYGQVSSEPKAATQGSVWSLSLIHISEPTRRT